MRYFSEKEWAAENESVDFEIGDKGTSAHLHWGLKKNSCIAESVSREKYTLRVLLMCLEAFMGETGTGVIGNYGL